MPDLKAVEEKVVEEFKAVEEKVASVFEKKVDPAPSPTVESRLAAVEAEFADFKNRIAAFNRRSPQHI